MRFPLSLSMLALGGGLLACSGSSTPDPQPQPTPARQDPAQPAIAMATSDRCEAVRDLMIDIVVHQTIAGTMNPYLAGGSGGMARPPQPVTVRSDDAARAPSDSAPDTAKAERRVAPSASPPSGDSAAATGPSHYTTTNTQERNVDEADLVKTDGKYVYTLRNGELMIVKAWPVGASELVARVAFGGFQPGQLYLRGDQLIAVGSVIGASGFGASRVAVVDIHDRSNPRIVRTVEVDGSATSSRLINGDLYLVQNSALEVPARLSTLASQAIATFHRADQQSLRPWEVQSRIANTLRGQLQASLNADDISDSLPKLRSDGTTRGLRCSDLYVPHNATQLGLTALARISIDGRSNDLVGAMVTGGTVYASEDAVYVAAPAYTWNPQGAANYQTHIHKFGLTTNDGRPTYIASGAVDGQLLNQFSMSEYKGDLRVATTEAGWGPQSGNDLFVLRPEGHTLKMIGALKNLGKGERIFAARMFGERGYLVTFRQTDPLFTLDLSDPHHPKVAGELKINGFSNYIHPLDGNLLLAIGQDATDTGMTTGFHMQVFDVSNPARPVRKFHEKLSSWSNYSVSSAQGDHHAFTYDPVTGTLALPVAGQSDDGVPFNALVVYHLDRKDGFTLAGRVTHRQLARELIDRACEDGDPWAGINCSSDMRRYSVAQYAEIDRSIVLERYLVTIGAGGLEVHSIDRVSERAGRVRWPQIANDGAARLLTNVD